MEITKGEASTIAWCLSVAHDEARLHSTQLELMVRMAKFAEYPEKIIARYERRLKEEQEEEAYWDAKG